MPVKRRKLQSILPAPAVLSSPPFPNQRLLTLKQAAQYLATSVWYIRELLRRKEFLKIQQGKKFVVDIVDLDAYIERKKGA